MGQNIFPERQNGMVENAWNTSLYDQKHAFVSEYGKGLLPLLEPQSGEVILDLGCGSGHLAHMIAQSGARVTGIDSATSMIEAARATYPDIEFFVADAQNFAFPFSFDAIFSNAALHWVRDAERAVQHMAAALKLGGRLVAEFGGKGNVATITMAVEQSLWELAHVRADFGWYFPSIGTYASLLEQHGFIVRSAALFDRPTLLSEGDAGLRNWIAMFGERVFTGIAPELKQQVLKRAEELTRTQLFKGGHWFADYKRLRIVAYKEEQ